MSILKIQGKSKIDSLFVNNVPPITLYFTNQGGDNFWSNPLNWNSLADGSGESPAVAPWTTTETSNAILLRGSSFHSLGDVYWNFVTPFSISGSNNLYVKVLSGGVVSSGTFAWATIIEEGGVVSGGTHSGYVRVKHGGEFVGGTVTSQSLDIYGGTITGGSFTCEKIEMKDGGSIEGGTFSYPETFVYFRNVENSHIYFGEFFCPVSNGTEYSLSAAVIHDGIFHSYVNNYKATGWQNGVRAIINGGTFSGEEVTNNGIVNGGNFLENFTNNSYGIINGGTFVQAKFTNNGGTVSGGSFL